MVKLTINVNNTHYELDHLSHCFGNACGMFCYGSWNSVMKYINTYIKWLIWMFKISKSLYGHYISTT